MLYKVTSWLNLHPCNVIFFSKQVMCCYPPFLHDRLRYALTLPPSSLFTLPSSQPPLPVHHSRSTRSNLPRSICRRGRRQQSRTCGRCWWVPAVRVVLTSSTPRLLPPPRRSMRRRSLRIQLLSVHPSRRADFLRRREWFIGTGLDLLPSSRSRRPQYHRRCRLLRRIHVRLHHDDEDSLSTCRGIVDGFDYAPILDNLQAIASNRRIEYGGDEELYTIDSCFGFTPSEIRYTFRNYPDSFLRRTDYHQDWFKTQIPKKLLWVYQSASALRVSFHW